MNSINNSFVNALLADATYVNDLSPGQSGTNLEEDLSDRMTPTLAGYIAQDFSVVTQIETDEWLGSGFDATVWRRTDGRLYVSMRGTEFGQDMFVTDVDLAFSGKARLQIVDMVNWWFRETGAEGAPVGQIKLAFPLPGGPRFELAAPGVGTGRITAIDLARGVEVNGHSLGGYLASAFTRLFGSQSHVVHTSTFNSAGFALGSESAFTELQNLIGVEYGLGRYPNQTEQSNYFAANGLNVTTNSFWFDQVGRRVELFNEMDLTQFGNHFMYKLTDALAFGNALAQLDPTFDTVRLNAILSSGSNQMASSIEGVFDGLQRLLLGPSLGPIAIGDVADSAATRTSYHATLKALSDTNTFQSLIGELEFESVNAASNLADGAKADFIKFITLQQLIPFSVRERTGNGALLTVLQGMYIEAYEQWLPDQSLTQEQRELGMEAFTSQYLLDRQTMLLGQVDLNQTDASTVQGTAIANYTYTDIASGLAINFRGTASNANIQQAQQIKFGDGQNNSVIGTDAQAFRVGDHLYGGSGNDSINALSGDDYLEGNAGNDSLSGGNGADKLLGGIGDDNLDGGDQADILVGGTGNDTYILKTTDGVNIDTINDADGLGSIKVFDAGNTETTLGQSTIARVADGTNLWRSEDQLFTYGTQVQSDGSTTLTIEGAGVRAQVLSFSDGSLGISLPGMAPGMVVPDTTGITVEGDRQPVDFDPIASGVQTQLDEWGNVITQGAEPDRADTFYDSPGNDLVISYGGADLVYATRGGEDLVQSGAGIDYVELGADNDMVELGSERDAALGGAGNDQMYGDLWTPISTVLAQSQTGASDQADLLSGEAGEDTLVGGDSADALLGGDGKDALVGGAGGDLMFGDRSAQSLNSQLWSFVFEPEYTSGGNPLDINLLVGGMAVAGGAVQDADFMLGAVGGDVMFGDGGSDYMDGGAGQDWVFGGGGSDTLHGAEDADWLHGDGHGFDPGHISYVAPVEHGKDWLDGGDGNDKLLGGGGDDELLGGLGNDIMDGDQNALEQQYHGADTLDGGDGGDSLYGGGKEDTLLGAGGDDFLYGDKTNSDLIEGQYHGADLLDGGVGDDQLVGDGAADMLFGGVGIDYLYGDNPFVDAADHGADYLEGNEDNDQLVGGGGNDTLLGGAGHDNLFGDDDGASGATEGDDLMQGDAGDDYLQGYGGADQLAGGMENDTLFGQSGADTLEGGQGYDQLIGGEDGDTYVFTAGDTSAGLELAEYVNDAEGVNHIVLNGMDLASMTLVPTTDAQVHLLQTGLDSIFIRGLKSGAIGTVQLGETNYTASAFFGQTYVYNVNESSSTSSVVLQGGRLGDNLTSTGGNSTLAGGAGTDALTASGGNNTFSYNQGDGSETITDSSALLDANGQPQSSKVLFGPGIAPESIELGYVGGALRLGFGANQPDELLINGFNPLNALAQSSVDLFEFADGSVLNRAELLARGFDLTGTESSEYVFGTSVVDRLTGGVGNDLLVGRAGDDVYAFNPGDGADSIGDSDTLLGSNDTLRFGTGMDSADVQASRSYNHLTLVIGTDSVSLQNYYLGGVDAVEHFEFADGTQWTAADLQARMWLGSAANDSVTGDGFDNLLFGQVGDDQLFGMAGNDTLSGGEGVDTLDGGVGDDRYVFNIGDETEFVLEDGGADVLEFGVGITTNNILAGQSGNDLWFSVAGIPGGVEIKDHFLAGTDEHKVEVFEFADGTVWGQADVVEHALRATDGAEFIEGFSLDDLIDAKAGDDIVFAGGGNDTVIGGAGSDALRGQAGNDSYLFGLNAGDDLVAEDYGGLVSDFDQLVYLDAISYADATFKRLGNDLVISSVAKGFSTLVANQFATNTNANGVEQVSFADGISLDRAMLRQEALRASDGNDTLEGGDAGDAIDGLAGDDRIYGMGGDDTLRGGTGEDFAFGGLGDDVFLFHLGDQHDIVGDGDFTFGLGGGGGFDTLSFGDGIAVGSVVPTRSSGQLLLTINAIDRVQVLNYFDRGDFEQVQFADGTVWTQKTIAQLLPINGTEGSDQLQGTSAADVINGLGNGAGTVDSLNGLYGDDSLDGGAGADSVIGGEGNDTLRGGADSARKITYRDSLVGGSGNDLLFAGSAPADMYGGSGNDIDLGSAGIDAITEDASDNSRNFMYGAAGADSIRMHGGGTGLAIGGVGADAINGGLATGGINSRLVLAFNKSDGADVAGLLAAGSTISIGGGTLYSNLSFEVVGLNLRLKTASSHYIELVGWYGTGVGQGKNVSTLQIVTEGTNNYSATSSDPMKNRKIQSFNFLALVAAYDAAGRPSNFSIANNLAAVRLGGSDTDAMGGAIAYQYARTGNLGSLSYAQMQAVVNDAAFGTSAQPIAAPAAAAATEAQATEAHAAEAPASNETLAAMAVNTTSADADADAGAVPGTTALRSSGDSSSQEASIGDAPGGAAPPVLVALNLPATPLEQAPTPMAQDGLAGSSAMGVAWGASAVADPVRPATNEPAGESAQTYAFEAVTDSMLQAGGPTAGPVIDQAGVMPAGNAQSIVESVQDRHQALIDQWFSRSPQNDALTLFDEILGGDSGASAQIQLSPGVIVASWQRSHSYLNNLAPKTGAGESYADAADVAGWSNIGLDAGRFAMPGAAVGLRGVAGHDIKTFKGLQEGMNQLGSL